MHLEIEKISKSYGNEEVIKDLSLQLEANKTLSILGKSGCGKTTMLKIIAGLTKPDNGSIKMAGKDISDLSPEKRGIVYLYQEDLLFPHLNVFENIAFGLRIRKENEADINRKVNEMLLFLELEKQAQRMPHELSGGQRQRVSFGRAIIINPSILLLDEPFGSLDSGTRQRMQHLFKDMADKFQITSLLVTHDLKEAILMGDQIGFMKKGRLQVYNSRDEFINDPQTGVQSELHFWEGLKNEKTEQL
ncbi:hypothetical protein GCM10027429_29560 [Marivirga atlantica]|uniref:ABC transporter ATP-binding protein n=1 Tax=Marivirga atlantica TaxID=1548457 RepID=A0A937DK22_9BACT|nr:ABC transporter ATP-binding protein [Marivirga atlantica]MBL0766535.1 ABC transporter ATP-binding protein [Marivirga atlantica]